ncbi:MAG TPA: hypothetical protein VGQ65_10195 [Thermoanaerobaculia bacterium]|jgi:hypothetical protein|nr:hypothetical protein [Thermoanaerobaculia bacterium]
MKNLRLSDDRRHLLSSITAFVVVLGLVLAVVATVLSHLGKVIYQKPKGLDSLLDAAVQWFDPSFFLYNLLLSAFAVLIVPFLTIHYVASMRREKVRRLKRELCDCRQAGSEHDKPMWGDDETECERNIRDLIRPQFRLRNYLPSMFGMSMTVAFGIVILLLAKPVFITNGASHLGGVDYARGANMLLLGPKVAFYTTTDPQMFRQVLISLCAFQFGFLGAFVYAISSLVWSYFNVDLTPHTLVAGSVRMVTASVLAIVLGFFIPSMPYFKGDEDRLIQLLPVAAFFLGYFPDRGLVLLQRAGRLLLQVKTDYASMPMHRLPGIGISDEGRLGYEGFSNLEQIEHSDPLDLAIRTGYSYTQLNSWREQAWLASRLRDQYPKWIECTGILGRDELRLFFERVAPHVDTAIDDLSAESGVPKVKLHALHLLLCKPHAAKERVSLSPPLLPVTGLPCPPDVPPVKQGLP